MTRKIRTTVKPLSANKAFLGKKIRTYDYNKYRKVLLEELPTNVRIPRSGNLYLDMVVYYSNKASDIDNCLKPFIDILQEKYNFNDNRIYLLRVRKEIVKKGNEGIRFQITQLKGTN